MKFSERQGLVKVRSVLQSEGITDAIRNGLWDGIHLHLLSNDVQEWRLVEDVKYGDILRRLWHLYFKKPIDLMPDSYRSAMAEVRQYFFKCVWFEVFDFVEFITEDLQQFDERIGTSFRTFVNNVLERELSAYRLVDSQFTPITSEEEIASIENALNNTSAMVGPHAHLKSALALLANRDKPDYRNSVKESISAVESIAKLLTGQPKATLGEALQKLEAGGLIHPALKKSLSALYGYTSDADGIRHAMLDEPKLGLTDAKFMLVSCTGFINYLVAKAAEGGIAIKT
ncbi:AbiJ-NTD4 domain-containing protein [Pseudoxanthomonas japonensis]|uniref:HEPN AbiJ-N-terminal domain-containing protein n=1 Tax=Pseudoxanthomonas japonensis TaxID=69284 RepID=A0ABQ6ZLC3_9GAMM|nr:hypothetical protein [Pseudoxanthomonas japonensis]KAF1727064.1 hypothetical protein CSC78_02970 [Pseudoxanthomonas japonensis]